VLLVLVGLLLVLRQHEQVEQRADGMYLFRIMRILPTMWRKDRVRMMEVTYLGQRGKIAFLRLLRPLFRCSSEKRQQIGKAGWVGCQMLQERAHKVKQGYRIPLAKKTVKQAG
jgi:hypothetical protein